MEVWRAEVIEGRRPGVLSGRNFVVALVIHLLLFLIFWGIAVVKGLLEPKETVIPIDLTVIVNENLDKTAAQNVVFSVVFNFRGYDTMGESFILIAAIAGSLVILRKSAKAEKEAPEQKEEEA